LKYVEIGDVLAQTGGENAMAASSTMPPATSTNGSGGMTGFDGSSITLNVPPDAGPANTDPVRVSCPGSGVVDGSYTDAAVRPARSVQLSTWGQLGAPTRRVNQPIGHYRMENTMLVRQTPQNSVQSATPTPGSQAIHHNSSFGYSHH
jgi:hypothetical protein